MDKQIFKTKNLNKYHLSISLLVRLYNETKTSDINFVRLRTSLVSALIRTSLNHKYIS